MKKIKLFFLRNKERLFRFLIVFTSCISLSFSCFCVPSSAETVYNISFSQPQLDEYSGYLEIITSNWGPCVVWFRAYNHDSSAFSSSVSFHAFVVDNSLEIFSNYPDTSNQLWVTGFITDANGYSSSLTTNQYYASFSLSNCGSITNVNAYNCSLSSSLEHTSPMTFVYGSDTVLNQKVDLINITLNSIKSNTSLTLDKVHSLISLITTTNSNLGQIRSIILSEGSLTRKRIDNIINYLEAAENGAYYNPTDDGTVSSVTNQQQKDEQVMQGTSTGRTEANNAISGLSGLLTTTSSVFKGSSAMTKVFNLFAQSAYLAPILQISLVLGISSFVLGTAFIVVGRIRNKKE